MGRLVPEKFDDVPYTKDDSIIGFYLKIEEVDASTKNVTKRTQ